MAEITGLLDLTGWPEGMRVIMRREKPHPGARLRFDDVGGYRLTALATNTRTGQLWIVLGVVEGLNPWRDEEQCPHPGSAPMSSDDVRSG